MTSQKQLGLNKVKASVFRRWLVMWAYSPRPNHPLDGVVMIVVKNVVSYGFFKFVEQFESLFIYVNFIKKHPNR